jgi:hypothetical protein
MSDLQFATASQRLRTNGIELSGPSGTLTKDGVTAKYAHALGVLTVEIIEKPFFMPLSAIEGRLKAYIDQSLATDVAHPAG